MIVLLTGGCKNGKSNTAQDIACALKTESGGALYYVATMESTGKEDDERIRKHVENREGLGFETIEISRDIKRLCTEKEKFLGRLYKDGEVCTFLIDSLTALLAGEMFRTDENGKFAEDLGAAQRVCEDLRVLCKEKDYNLIFVSDGIYSDAAIYDKSTEAYREGLALIEREVAGVADKVMEMCAGKEILHIRNDKDKAYYVLDNSVDAREDSMDYGDGQKAGMMNDKKEKKGILIVGGAGQGKLEFAKELVGTISNDDIYTFEIGGRSGKSGDCRNDAISERNEGIVPGGCRNDATSEGNEGIVPGGCRNDATYGGNEGIIPGGCRIYSHAERIVRGAYEDVEKIAEYLADKEIVICEDITCGIVPVDATDRKWREDVGRLMQALAKNRRVYRVICGIGEEIG